jgi:hypothetical protein
VIKPGEVPFLSNLCGRKSQYLLRSTSKMLLNTWYEGESNENRKNSFKFNLLNESGTQLYHFST